LSVETTLEQLADDVRLVIESLGYTRENFRNYPYPTRELQSERMEDVNRSLKLMRELRDQLKIKIKESNGGGIAPASTQEAS